MAKIEKVSGVKAHTRYYVDGKRVPGVTTILGVLNKPFLVKWANNMGLQGIDTTKYVDKMASIGTLAHYLVECELLGQEPDLDAYSPEELDRAENALIKFYDWQSEHEVEPIMVEGRLVSKKYRYGGTADCVANVDGKLTLVDIKTGKAIYPEMFCQLAAYLQALRENGFEDIETVRILRIGRTEGEGFEERVMHVNDLKTHWEIFKHCLEIYRLKKEVRWR